MWHRSKDVPNNESFWKESSNCATENDQFWRISGTTAPTALASERSKQRSLRRSFTSPVLSHLRHGANKEWQFYCGDCCLELEAETLTSVQRCLQLTTLNVTLSACQRGPRYDLWWMRWKSGTLCARKSITFLHQPPPQNLVMYTQKLHSWSIIFAPYLIIPLLRFNQCGSPPSPTS